MRIRRVKPSDIPQLSRLYYETVHRVNTRDYGPEQIQAWAPRVYPDAFWQRRFRRYRVLVAEDGGAVVGFVELGRTGEIDCFYVQHAHHRRGIGAALVARMLFPPVFLHELQKIRPPRHRLSIPHCSTARKVAGRSVIDPGRVKTRSGHQPENPPEQSLKRACNEGEELQGLLPEFSCLRPPRTGESRPEVADTPEFGLEKSLPSGSHRLH